MQGAPAISKSFNAEQYSCSADGQAALWQLQLIKNGDGYVGLHHETVRACGDIHSVDVAGRADDALGVGEAVDEVFKVGGRGKQGGVADAVVFQCDRYFLGYSVGFVAFGVCAPARSTGRKQLTAGAAACESMRARRSEERRVGKEGVSPCRSRWSRYPKK